MTTTAILTVRIETTDQSAAMHFARDHDGGPDAIIDDLIRDLRDVLARDGLAAFIIELFNTDLRPIDRHEAQQRTPAQYTLCVDSHSIEVKEGTQTVDLRCKYDIDPIIAQPGATDADTDTDSATATASDSAIDIDSDPAAVSAPEDDLYFVDAEATDDAFADILRRVAADRIQLHEIVTTIATIDADHGNATLSISHDTLHATLHVPELTDPTNTLLQTYDWDDHTIDYDGDDALYTLTLERTFETLSLRNPDRI